MRKVILRRKLMWAVVAVIIAVLAAGCSKAPTSRVPEPPKTPEELAVRLFGEAREGSQDPGIFEAAVDEAGAFTVKARVIVLTSDSVAQCKERVKELVERGFAFEELASIHVEMVFVYRDASGNIRLETGLTAKMLRETFEKTDWAALTIQGFAQACDEWWLAEAFGG